MVRGVVGSLVALASCARPAPPPRHATAGDARPVVVDWRRSSVAFPITRPKHVVTARAGGATDWYVLEVDRTCSSIEVELASEVAPAASFAVDVFEPDGQTQSTHITLEPVAERTAGAHPHTEAGATKIENAHLGHYYVSVHALDGQNPKYRLRAHDATSGFECGDLPTRAPGVMRRPATVSAPPPAPSGMIGAPIAAWLRYGEHGYTAEIEAGYDDGVGHTVGAVLDDQGQPIPGVELRVDGYEAHRAHGELVGDPTAATIAWAVAIRPLNPPPPPLAAHVRDRWARNGAVFVALDRGTIDGVQPGWRGTYRGGVLDIVEVHGVTSIARLAATRLDDVLDLGNVQLAPVAR